MSNLTEPGAKLQGYFLPTWQEIAGKARHYRTARLRSTMEVVGVALVGIDTWSIRRIGHVAGLHCDVSTIDLCDFVL